MNDAKRGPGRPRLPDPAGEGQPVRAEMLPQELLEARRAYDRLRQRRYRDARRRNRNNPLGLKPGVDGLTTIHPRSTVPAPRAAHDQLDELPVVRMMREIRRAQGRV